MRRAGPIDERDKDVERKQKKRSAAAEVFIPEPLDIVRRERCLADPERFLRTYFSAIFYNPFASHHQHMIQAIHERALNGGDKAVAAPRGDGKSQVTIGMVVYVLLATPIMYPMLIGGTAKKARNLFKQTKAKFSSRRKYPEFVGDFPEITACIEQLDGAPQRSAKQHVRGVKTDIIWSQEKVRFPYIEGSPWGGKCISFAGLDSNIRGENDEGLRPDLAVIDDPETREVAFSPTNQHESIEEMIDGDIAGLAGPDASIARVVLTTIQNRRCYSYRVTDPKKKPTFAGERYGVLAQWPERRDMWDEYISIRQQAQAEGDKDGLAALQFYLDNREEMERGAVVTNPSRFNRRVNAEGEPVEVSALQAFFNRVADWGLPRVLAELQNDPEEEETEQTIGLTAGIVQSRLSGFEQHELPREDCRITVGIDVGKWACHWVKIAWFGNATGIIIDYGVLDNPWALNEMEPKAVEVTLIQSLMAGVPNIMAENPPEFCLIDSGDYRDAVYEFVRRQGGTFAACKGQPEGRLNFASDESNNRRVFHECRAELQKAHRIWLYHVNSWYWKGQVQQRFMTATLDEANQFQPGSLSLFVDKTDRKKHFTFSKHIVSEELQELFVEGKGLQRKWVTKNKNNHYLDATAYACCAAGVLGIKVVEEIRLPDPTPVKRDQSEAKRFVTPRGQAYLATER